MLTFAGEKMEHTKKSTVSELTAKYHNGQIFLQWRENQLPKDSLLNVYKHSKLITDKTLSKAIRIGHHIQPRSARDWWKDPSAFKKGAAQGKPVGFLIGKGIPPLDPASGLFVHTVTKGEGKKQYYAVTVSSPDGTEGHKIVVGENSLKSSVSHRPMPTQAIWCGKGQPPIVPANLPVVLHLAGGAGPNDPNYNYLAFGDATMGWREGLPVKFKVIPSKNCLNVFPSDRVWYNRILGGTSHFRTITGIALHFGYNSNIYDEEAMKKGTIINYNEKRLLWILDWLHRAFETDRNRVHAIGSSGGGAGLMLALHHPSVFASVCARVPCVSYKTSTNPSMASHDFYTKVLKMLCGEYDGRIPYAPGLGGFSCLDGASCLKRHSEFPFLVTTHGRNDGPTPWSKNPEFFQALNRHRVGFITWWDDGRHATAGKNAPKDVKDKWTIDYLLTFSKNKSFPAFSNCSDNKKPGNGDPKDGDIIGWMNRGFKWSDIVDSKRDYAISVQMTHPDVKYPVTTDMTLRYTQKFKPKPGQTVQVVIDKEKSKDVVVDKSGNVTIKTILFNSPSHHQIELKY